MTGGPAEEITKWGKAECADGWLKLTGTVVGRHLSPTFLSRALAFETQCKALGGHSAPVKQQLRGMMKNNPERGTTTPSKPTLTPGSQLVREWNGRIYRVLVTDDGFEMDGQTYRSLSAIAKRITGADWSGPRFFGLNKSK
ncbi:DUF2924 domain-containing protein [Loktanella sp. Alg231-35]|uniref:DUF2924 domain-containing protein n=1 Tax=Loktanella sp. Alg231-35 TaxID=1922220 RepID=UPI000D54D9C0|nr:DUF2924 domain-containing protein [Loktanella sp. Alg231-35]